MLKQFSKKSTSEYLANILRILILGLNFQPEPTGIGKYTGEMAAYLSAQGHKVRMVTAPPYYPHWRVQQPYHAWQYRRETWRGVRIYRCPVWVPRRVSGIKRILHLLSFAISSTPAVLLQTRWKPDLVMAIAPAILSAPNALLIARLTGARTWLHIQDYEFEAATRLGILPRNANLQGWMETFERAILMRFNRVSSISPTMIDRAAKIGVPQERLELIPNWVDLERIYPDGSSPEAFGLPQDKVIALYSGNLGQKQGLLYLIELARRMEKYPEVYFVICGEGSMRLELEELAAQAPNVQFLPLQPEEKLNALLNAADIHLLPELPGASDLVMPSKLGGMLASGRPIVASAAKGSQMELVVSQAGLVVPPGDIAAMADAIQRLASDPNLRIILGARGREYAEDYLSKDAILGSFASKLSEFVSC